MTVESTRLYHYKVFLPEGVRSWGEKHIDIGEVSKHALEKSENRGIRIPESIFFTGEDIIEMETFSDGSIKFIIRVDYDYNNDLCLAIRFFSNWNRLITLYLNDKYDDHRSLDASKYYDPFN